MRQNIWPAPTLWKSRRRRPHQPPRHRQRPPTPRGTRGSQERATTQIPGLIGADGRPVAACPEFQFPSLALSLALTSSPRGPQPELVEPQVSGSIPSLRPAFMNISFEIVHLRIYDDGIKTV